MCCSMIRTYGRRRGTGAPRSRWKQILVAKRSKCQRNLATGYRSISYGALTVPCGRWRTTMRVTHQFRVDHQTAERRITGQTPDLRSHSDEKTGEGVIVRIVDGILVTIAITLFKNYSFNSTNYIIAALAASPIIRNTAQRHQQTYCATPAADALPTARFLSEEECHEQIQHQSQCCTFGHANGYLSHERSHLCPDVGNSARSGCQACVGQASAKKSGRKSQKQFL